MQNLSDTIRNFGQWVLVYIALIICGANMLSAQHVQLFSSDNELSSSLINKVLYDSRGFLWIATEDGLNRFDGSRFDVFRNVPGDSTSLADNFVTELFEDKNGNLFVSTYAGVQIYDPVYDAFTPNDKNFRDKPIPLSINAISQKRNGLLVIGGNYLVEAALTPSNSLRVARLLQGDTVSEIRNIAIDNKDNVWFTTNRPGVNKVSPKGEITTYLDSPLAPRAISIAIDANGTVYVGASKGALLTLKSGDQDFSKVADAGYPIMSILPVPGGDVLVGTDGDGLNLYDPVKQALLPLPFADNISKKLKVHALDIDEYGNLWIGAYQKGLFIVPAQNNAFSNLGPRNMHSQLIGEACVTAVLPEDDGSLWVGTDNDGVYLVNPSRTDSRHFSTAADFPNVVNKLYVDSKDNLWAASYDKGVGTIDRATGKYHRLDMLTPKGRPIDRVFDIVDDGKGRMFIATMGSGLYVKEGQSRPRQYPTTDSYNPWITCMAYDSTTGKLYFGTYDGIFEVNGERISHLLTGNIVTSIHIMPDSSDIWVGTLQGLKKLDKRSNQISALDGPLSSTTVHAVENHGKNLWVSTNSGLFSFDPASGQLVNFTYTDGIQGNEFYKRASYAAEDGTLYFGGVNGITYFNPDDLTEFESPHQVRVNRFYVVGNEIKAGDFASGSDPVTTKAVFETDTFFLASSDVTFSLDFNVRDPFVHSAPTFLYSLDGGDWQETPRQNSANFSLGSRLSFSHLPAGTHELRLKAVDKGAESELRTVYISIAPPWYATVWAKILYLLVAVAIIVGILYYWRMRQRNKIAELNRRHEEEVKEGKLQYFTNVSHEIKAPMSLVVGPAEQLIAEDSDPGRQQLYRTILRNSNRILRLVNEIMDLRKIDKSQLKMDFRRVRLSDFMQDLYRTFQPAAQKKDITLTFDPDRCKDIEADIDIANFDKVMMNLLSNAIKYTPKGGKVDISVTTNGDNARIAVTDTGIGIPAAERERIFERFYRVADNFATGTGIGLHLASRLMSLHHGRVWVEDNPEGSGSRFVVEWPLMAEGVEAVTSDLPPLTLEKQTERRVRTAAIDIPDEVNIENSGGRKEALIYIVEDDNDIASYLCQQLGKTYKVQHFVNGKHALDAIHEKQPDMIISDVMMPDMDGLTLTKKIRDNIKLNHIPILLLTAKTRGEDFVEGLEAGADDYIAKPFSMAILSHKVKSLLSAHARLRNVFSGQQNLSERVEAPQAESHDDQLLKRVLKVISANLSNSDITIEMIAREIGISRVHLHRKLKEMTNQTTRDFIRNIRLQKAAEIMQSARINVSEVSDMVGFKNPNSFATLFKEMYGKTPSEYMAEKHGAKK